VKRDARVVTVSLAVLHDETAAVVQEARDSDQPMVITDRDGPAAVLLSVDEFERWLRDRELLRRLALGEMECAAGHGEDMDAVMADAEALLNEN
jgi:prevent-host-death family protein